MKPEVKALYDLALSVAELLGPEWSAEKPDADLWAPVVHVNGPEGRSLSLDGRIGVSPKGRIEIRANPPKGYHQETSRRFECKPITVASDKPAEHAAREIQRRLLPCYASAFGEAVERLSEARAWQDGRERLAARVARDFSGRRSTCDKGLTIWFGGATVEVRGTDSVHIKGDFTADAALAMLRALAAVEPKEGAA